MPRLTLGDIKNSRIPSALGVNSTDPRLLQWLNEAEQRLITKGLWFGTYGKYKICATSGCITLPPQLATLERVAVCGVPIPIHDLWFEFLENGVGTRNASSSSTSASGSCCGYNTQCSLPEANYRGQYPVFKDITGFTSKVNVACDLSSDIGKIVTVQGYDENSNWIRTQVSGSYIDGEQIALAQSDGTTSTNYFSVITSVTLTSRDGQAWLYQYDTSDSSKTLLGQYQYWETQPSYARYYFPSILAGRDTSGSCSETLVEAIGKLEHIDVSQDSDFLILTSLPAFKDMMLSLKKREDAVSTADVQEAAAYEASAIMELDHQLDSYLGSGRRTGMDIIGSSVGTNDPVINLW